MKFLNKIDGADKIVTDANNRLVTDVQIAEWDSKANGAHEHSTSEITDFPTSLPASGGNADTISGFTVGTNVPSNAKFTDTNTTYSAGTGLTLTGTTFTPDFGTGIGKVVQGNDSRLSDARTPLAHNHPKSEITGLPTKLSDFSKDINFDERYYTENETDTLLGDKTDKTYVDSELGKKQNSLGYTPVNKSGDTMTGQLGIESTTFPVIDIARNTSSTGGNLYGGARLQRKTTNPTNGVGIGFYFQAPNSNKTMTHAGMFGGALGTIQAGSEKGEIVLAPSYAGQDPYTRRDLVIRAISASKAEAELNGKLTADNTVYSDAPNTVTTKKYVDDGLDKTKPVLSKVKPTNGSPIWFEEI